METLSWEKNDIMKDYSDISIVIPLYWDSLPCAHWNLKRLLNIYNPKKIVLIGPVDIQKELPVLEKVEFIDEDSVLEGLSKRTVSKIVESRCGSGIRGGWYFQQFLKLGYALGCDDEYYLVFDMDTAVKNVDFFDEENRPFFYIGNENHGEYMETLEQLLPGMIPKYKENISFIVNYMLFKTDYVKELLEKVAKSAVEGSSWWEKILYSIRPDYINESGFSEFETYGNYVMKYHFGEYSLRSISQYRTVNAFISMNPSARQLDWAFESFDSITFEDWPGITFLGISKLLMKLHISLKTITSVVDFFAMIWIQCKYHMNKLKAKICIKGAKEITS